MKLCDIIMFTQYHSPRARRFLDHELVSPHPPLRFYHGRRQDVDGYYGLQNGQNMDVYGEGTSLQSYAGETVSWNQPLSSGPLSTIATSESGLDDGCVGFCGNDPESFNFAGRSDLVVPPTDLPLLLSDAAGLGPFNAMTGPMSVGNPFTIANPYDQLTLNETVSIESPVFDSLNDAAMRNEGLLSPTENSFLVGHSGRVIYHLLFDECKLTSTGSHTMLSDNYNGHAIDLGFLGRIDVNAMNIDLFDPCLPDMQSEPPNPLLSPTAMMDGHCLTTSSPYMGAPSSNIVSLPPKEVNWDLGIQPHTAERPSHYFSSIESQTNTSEQSYSYLSTVGSSALYGGGPHPFLLTQEQKRARPLQPKGPKPTPSFFNIVEGSKIQKKGKSGCRSGPLSEDQRMEAYQIRLRRACANCKFNKIKVG